MATRATEAVPSPTASASGLSFLRAASRVREVIITVRDRNTPPPGT